MKLFILSLVIACIPQAAFCQKTAADRLSRINDILTEISAKQKELADELKEFRKSQDPAADVAALAHIWTQQGTSPNDQIRGAIGFMILDTPNLVYSLSTEGVHDLDSIIQGEFHTTPLVSGIVVDSFVDVQNPKTFDYVTPERFKNPLGGSNHEKYRAMFASSIQRTEISIKASEFISRDLNK